MVAVVPSPKSQRYEAIVPSESVEPADEKAIGRPTRCVVGVAAAAAVGSTLGTASTSMSIVALEVAPSASATVSVAVYSPGVL